MKTIVGNWKMNLGVRESVALARAMLLLLRGKKVSPQLILCPSFISLGEVHKVLARSSALLGAQTVSSEDHGAFTGEISIRMLSEVGVSHVIIGHSERRTLFSETDLMINQKIQIALEHHLVPIVCVGETKQERASGDVFHRMRQQLESAFHQIHLKHSDRIFIAYEPIWAIGSGVTPTVDEIIEVHKHIRLTMQELYPKNSSLQVSVLYGGSVQSENAYALLREPLIEGLLVGGASLKIHEMKPIVDAACEVLIAQSQS